jgi:DNA-binding transcriptional ArsR family regulator
MKKVSYESYGVFFETLASETRLRIINALRVGPLNQGQIVRATALEQSCASHCTRKLLEHGFVTASKHGKFTMYELNHDTIEPLMALIDRHAQKYCARAQRRRKR